MLPEVVSKIGKLCMEALTPQTRAIVLDLSNDFFQNRRCVLENGEYLVLLIFSSPESALCSTSAEPFSFVTTPLCPKKSADSSELPLSNTAQTPF